MPIPRELRLLPFRGSDAIRRGLVTKGQLRGSTWRRLMSDVYVAADVTMDYRMWCYAAAQFSLPYGALAGMSAAFLHGIDLQPSLVDVVVPTSIRMATAPQVRLTRSPLPPEHVTVVSAVRVTTPARTGFDLARRLPVQDAVAAIDALCFRRVLKLADLVDFAAFHRRWPGCQQLPFVLDMAEPLSESPMETRLRLVLVDGGLPRPVAQFEVRDSGTFIGRLDLAYPQWKIGIEYDGDQHRTREAFAADLARQNRLRAAGWTILRFTARDVFRKPDELVAIVRSVLPS